MTTTRPTTTTLPAAYLHRVSCRGCGGPLDDVLHLGSIVPSDFLLPEEPDLVALPLTLAMCRRCQLVQLRQTVDDDLLYRRYWYQSGINEVMRAELADVVASARLLMGPKGGATVVDVGANDGTLLSNYEPAFHRIAFEPAANLIARCAEHADVVYSSFFPGPDSQRLPTGSVAILTSIAMFYDLEDPRAFVREVDRLLQEDGVWVVQFQDLAQQVQTNAVDNCCFEHRLYLSLASLTNLLDGTDLAVVHVERRAINGGSLRVMIRRQGDPVDPSVAQWWAQEARWVTPYALEVFAWQAEMIRGQIRGLVERAVEKSGPVDLYAASTKASTLVQYTGIGAWIRQGVERTPEKVGRRTSGTGIPIVREEEWRARPSAITVLGAWQFTEAFLQREAQYLRNGGAFLVPLPHPRLVFA